MARYPRSWTLDQGLSFHKTWRGHNREWNLKTNEEKRMYTTLLTEEHKKRCQSSNPLHAICIMSNHSHEIYTLENLHSFSEFMRQHHGRYGMYFNRKHARTGKVAQERPKTTSIQNDHHEMMAVLYIHANPIRAGICKDAKDYIWSTHKLYAFGIKPRWMKSIDIAFPHWYLNLGNSWKERQKVYRKIFNSYLKKFGLLKLTFSSHGFGEYTWVISRQTMLKEKRKFLHSTAPPP
ncbi:MAG: transposase [Bdellovibrionales bacterium]|nr:transposase [Bdellovibrionales bacterium]